MKLQSFLTTKDDVKSMLRAMRKSNCFEINADFQAGTIVAKHEGEDVFRAIEKGKGQPWIVSHHAKLFQ
jgi:ribosome-associated translation inhibitor RaiA